jgi:hypothetical protein
MMVVTPQSLKVFLDKIIDYAGTYPPASLDLKTAFNNYLNYIKNSPYNWMLSRFVCAASKLEELNEIIQKDKIVIENPVSFSVVGSSSVHSSEFLDSVSRDADLIKSFENKYDKLITVGAFEVRLPGDVFSIKGDEVVSEIIKRTAEELAKISGKPIDMFFESKPDENLPYLAGAIASFNKSGGKAGHKLRTGGVEPSAFPAPGKIAYAFKTCRDFFVPMKCTAGLHHPVTHYNESVKAKMYGFINVFGAGVLHCCHELNSDVLEEILTDEAPGNFRFTDNSFHWKNFYMVLSKVEEARKSLMLSFGSCSFDEPVEDLKEIEFIIVLHIQ